MEELRQIARTYYKIASVEIRVKVNEFFNTMDVNKDGTISFFEFSNFMAEEGYNLFNNPSFFDEISTEKSNDLNRRDVITLFYIIQSGRPLCDGCRRLIMGLYFTCETCFKDNNGSSFDLHKECLANKQFIHKHANFIDNFALLHLMRKKRVSDERAARVACYSHASSYGSSRPVQAIHDVVNPSLQVVNPCSNSQLAHIVAQQNQHRKRKIAYKALKMVITVASVASNIGCTIM